ncbi:MAG: T9SS type A sorting domain-containing protein [Cyclobacteriaceae bacterium]
MVDNKARVSKNIYLFLFVVTSHTLFAQLKEVPVARYYKNQHAPANGRTSASLAKLDTISLPFWDDFSFSGPGVDTTLWQNGIGVFVNPAIGINQPTINVATFDGINLTGRPYNAGSDFVAATDSLISQAIDMSAVPVLKQNTVYLSFFWQMQGLGELPDENDSLRVEFFNRDGEWVKQWSIVGLEENLNPEFQKVYIPITSGEFYHSGFKFKFQSYGKTTGAFDSWHIDYVYLNQDRNTLNESIFDHAIATEPLSLFNTYTNIPYSQLFAFPDTIFSTNKVVLNSFENNIQPVEYDYVIKDLIANENIFEENSTINPLEAFGRGIIETAKIDKSIFNQNTDSLYLTTEFDFISGDKYFVQSINNGGADTTFLIDEYFNFRLNDTTRKEFIVHEILSYDDGSAEFAAGINQSNGEIAIEFVLAEKDSVTAIDIYFPLIKPVLSEGEQMNLSVFKNLSGVEGTLLAKQNFTIEPGDSINQFSRYTFENPVVVADTFYIGFQQFKDDFIGIGLDKNNNQGSKIFANTQGDWDRNIKVEGSLMMRPIFGKTDYDPNAILGINDKVKSHLTLYPNPAKNRVNVRGAFDHLELYTLGGQQMQLNIKESEIDATPIPNGIYILKAHYKDNIFNHKLIIQK